MRKLCSTTHRVMRKLCSTTHQVMRKLCSTTYQVTENELPQYVENVTRELKLQAFTVKLAIYSYSYNNIYVEQRLICLDTYV